MPARLGHYGPDLILSPAPLHACLISRASINIIIVYVEDNLDGIYSRAGHVVRATCVVTIATFRRGQALHAFIITLCSQRQGVTLNTQGIYSWRRPATETPKDHLRCSHTTKLSSSGVETSKCVGHIQDVMRILVRYKHAWPHRSRRAYRMMAIHLQVRVHLETTRLSCFE